MILTSLSTGSDIGDVKETLFQKIRIPLKSWRNRTSSSKYKHGIETIHECGMFCSLPHFDFNAFSYIETQKVCIVTNVSSICRKYMLKNNALFKS